MEAQELIDVLEEAGLNPQKYSGRGMYGRHCVSVTTSNIFSAIGEIILYMFDEQMIEEFCQTVLPDTKTDSMGHFDQVMYWPNLEWVDQVVEGEDEDTSDDMLNDEGTGGEIDPDEIDESPKGLGTV